MMRPGDPDLDYTKVDVWSLGCTFFAMLFGVSPFECEFRSHQNNNIKVVDCTQLKILGKIPFPSSQHIMAEWYSKDATDLIRHMLIQDRMKRPSLDDVMIELEDLISKHGGDIPKNKTRSSSSQHNDNSDDDLDALLSSHRFV